MSQRRQTYPGPNKSRHRRESNPPRLVDSERASPDAYDGEGAQRRAERRTTDRDDRGAGGSRTLVAGLPSQHSPVELRPRVSVVGLEGVAPPPLECETSILLLNYSPSLLVETEGSRTLITGLQDQGSPVELRPRYRREVGRNRTFVAGMSDRHSAPELRPRRGRRGTRTPNAGSTAHAVSTCAPRPAGLLPRKHTRRRRGESNPQTMADHDFRDRCPHR